MPSKSRGVKKARKKGNFLPATDTLSCEKDTPVDLWKWENKWKSPGGWEVMGSHAKLCTICFWLRLFSSLQFFYSMGLCFRLQMLVIVRAKGGDFPQRPWDIFGPSNRQTIVNIFSYHNLAVMG